MWILAPSLVIKHGIYRQPRYESHNLLYEGSTFGALLYNPLQTGTQMVTISQKQETTVPMVGCNIFQRNKSRNTFFRKEGLT